MAAWYFINHDCMDSVHAWVVSREGDTWFTASADHTLYAIATHVEDWKEGQRRRFLLHSVRGAPKTKVSVLGQNGRIIEYREADVSSRWRQTDSGLEVSVVKTQRIYDDHRWPDPVVIKLENVEPVFTRSIEVSTGSSAIPGAGSANGRPVFAGKVEGPWQGVVKKGYFYYRPYMGQIETLYAGPWKRTDSADLAPDGSFRLRLSNLDPRRSYEYRAAAVYYGVEINGEDKIYQLVPDPKLIE
jgi:alpha-L-fucosidase